MGKPNFSDDFKRDAVVQITERGYPVAEVSQRLSVSPHSLYAWKKRFAKVASGDASNRTEQSQLVGRRLPIRQHDAADQWQRARTVVRHAHFREDLHLPSVRLYLSQPSRDATRCSDEPCTTAF
ncbi:transposase [Sphingomonas faeni]|nr:transposase [Sphingomonas faeni]MCP8892807.1 transposase [Sphingomonas faeni]